MITQRTIETINEVAKIEEVVGDFVNLKRRGINMIGLCPFHNEKTPSFTVSPQKNIFKCFGCGQAGNPVGFIMEHEGLSYPEALRYLAKKYGIEVEESGNYEENREEKQLIDSIYILNAYAKDYFHQQLLHTDHGKSVGLSYFKSRGFLQSTIEKFELGYAPEKGDSFTLNAVQNNYKADLLKKVGLTTQYGKDFFRGRVMFPIRNLSGKVIGFGGRILDSTKKTAKYMNTPETEVYNKSKVLFGIYHAKKAIRQLDNCLLVEGYTDVISLHQSDIENVVASSGTALTEGQIQLIKRYSDNITILYDGDAAGIKAATRGLDLVLEQGMNVKVVMLPEGEDPDSYLQRVGTSAFKAYLASKAQDFILFKTQLILDETAQDPIKRANLIKDIVGSIARIPDTIKRSVYIRECANLMDIKEEVLIQETNRLIGKRMQQERAAPLPEAPTDTVSPTPQPAPRTAATTGHFQERDIVRVLIQHGTGEIEEGLTVAEALLEELEEVIDAIESPQYRKVIDYYQMAIAASAVPTHQDLTSHTDPDIQKLAIDVLSDPYDYSPNWEARYERPLESHAILKQYYTSELHGAVKRFKLLCVRRLYKENLEKIKAADPSDPEALMQLLKVQKHLTLMQTELATALNTVVF